MTAFNIGTISGTVFGEQVLVSESLFEDSDRFEEESLDSCTSEQDLSLINWRGWNTSLAVRPNRSNGHAINSTGTHQVNPETLLEICAKKVAQYYPFEAIEKYNDPIPVDVQLRISYWSFPTAASDIQLYACLGNGNADEFCRGEAIALLGTSVTNMLQIGFHLSGQVTVPPTMAQNTSGKEENFMVSVTFDRKRITHTNCACQVDIQWCRHVVALCLYRIQHPTKAEIRAPVSESLSRLQRDQLQKFAQYLISELPTQVLPTAQRLLDQLCGFTPCDLKIPHTERNDDTDLLSPSAMPINLIQGAPDPTAGPSMDDISMWTLDEDKLQSKLKRTLLKFVQIMPASVSDFASVYPQSAAPPASSEFNTLLRPIRGREPEPVWNLLAIVRELCFRQDPNSMLLLDIITQLCINIDALVMWWFTSRTAAHYYPNSANRGANSSVANRNRSSGAAVSSTVAGQQCCASLMDEVVRLWTLLLLNPRLGQEEKSALVHTMRLYHVYCIHKIQSNQGSCLQFKRNDLRMFQGFKPVIRAAMAEFPAQFYTENMFECCKPVLGLSQMLYTYPRVNNILDVAESLHSKMMDQIKMALQQRESGSSEVQKNAADSSSTSQMNNNAYPNIPADVLLDDEDDEYDQEDELNHSFDENVFAPQPEINRTFAPNTNNPNAVGASSVSNLISQSQISDSIDEGLDTSSRRASVASSGIHNLESSDFPPITHFNVLMGSGVSVTSDNPAVFHRGRNVSLGGNSDSTRALDSIDQDNPNSSESMVQRNNATGKESTAKTRSGKNRVFDIFADLVPVKCNIELLYLLMESLHAHSFRDEAYQVASELANALLNNGPDLLADPPPHTRFRRKIRYELSQKACQILNKIASVISVLSENAYFKTLAFRLGVCGLELARMPSPSKMFEVKMYHLETVILGQLRNFVCSHSELGVLRERAHYLANFSHFRGRYLLPLHLAMVIFENLCNENNPYLVGRDGVASYQVSSSNDIPLDTHLGRNETIPDMELGLRAALAVLAMKPQVAEADNPLLCESIRRGRTELTLSLLLKFRDNSTKLREILDALLDQGPVKMDTIVTMGDNQGHSGSKFSRSSVNKSAQFCNDDELYDFVMDSSESRSDSPFRNEDHATQPVFQAGFTHPSRMSRVRSMSSGSDSNAAAHSNNFPGRRGAKRTNKSHQYSASSKEHSSGGERFVSYVPSNDLNLTSASGRHKGVSPSNVRALALSSAENAACNISLVPSNAATSANNPNSKMNAYSLCRRWYRGKKCYSNVPVVPNQPSEALAHSLMELAKLVLVKASAAVSHNSHAPSVSNNMAHTSNSSSNVEYYNVPGASMSFASNPSTSTTIRHWNANNMHQNQTSGSSFNAFETGGRSNTNGAGDHVASRAQNSFAPSTSSLWDANIEVTPAVRYLAGRPDFPARSQPGYTGNPDTDHLWGLGNHGPSLTRNNGNTTSQLGGGFGNSSSGGASSSSFLNTSSTGGIHRGLHMAAFEIGLHALCVLNCVSSNWMSRTYSTYESWIQTQTLEIGSQALALLTDRWVGTLTPSEAAGIAQRAAKVYDSSVRAAGAELALSVLTHANTLNVTEISSCLEQCNEQGHEVLERACKCVEMAHEQSSPVAGSGVAPQILFKVARYYKKLHDNSVNADGVSTNQHGRSQTSGGRNQADSSHRGNRRDNTALSSEFLHNPSSNRGRQVNPSEESQMQASYDLVQHDLQQYLLQQFLFPSNFLLRPPEPYVQPFLAFNSANAAAAQQQLVAENLGRIIRPLSSQATQQQALSLLAGNASQNSGAVGVNRGQGLIPSTSRGPQAGSLSSRGGQTSFVGSSALDSSDAVSTAGNSSMLTLTRFCKRAFFSGIEAVKIIIRRSAENKEEFTLDKSSEHEEDLKWLIGLTIQIGRPDNHKILAECICSGGLKNPFLMHSLTDFAMLQLQQVVSAPPSVIPGMNAANLARQHYLYISLSTATWQRYVECLTRKLEVLGTSLGLGDEDLLQTVTSMRTAAITQYCAPISVCNLPQPGTSLSPSPQNSNPMQSGNHPGLGAPANNALTQQALSSANTVHRINEMSRLIVASRNVRPEMRDKIRQLFSVSA